jgi:signal transduction histidine kinase
VQLADLAVSAVDLLFTEPPTLDSVEQFAGELRATHGIRSVFPVDRRRSDRRPGDRRSRTNITISVLRAKPTGDSGVRPSRPSSLVVELAEPGDARWHGPDQRRRLESTLALITTAASANSGGEDGAALLDDGRCIIVRFDRHGWSALSDALTSVLGHPVDVTLKTRALSLVHPRDRRAAVRGFASARTAARATHPQDFRVRCGNGEWKVLEMVFVPTAAGPDPSAVIACALDVTDKRADRTRLHQIVMTSDCAALVVDENAELVLVNEAFTKLFPTRSVNPTGIDREAALRAISAQCPDDETAYRHLTDLVSQAPRSGQRLELVDGRVVALDFVPLRDEQLALGTVWHFRDMTAARSVHAQRERDDDAHITTEMQAEFLPALSHELRTPLTALLSFVDLLADTRLGPLNSDQRTAIDVIARNTNHLIRLVDDLLLLTMLESRQLPMRTAYIDVAQLVRAAVADRELAGRARDIVISCDAGTGPPLLGDAERLHQVMANVLGNALKFTRANGQIDVTASFERQNWTIAVHDSGIGIPTEDLGRITNGFTRGANARLHGIAGSGLGLAVTRHIVELHHGTLNIDSILNVGTTVRIALPVALATS